MLCHKTETCSKQQTDMNLLVIDGMYLLAARKSFWTCAKKYNCSSNSVDLYIGIFYIISREHARRNISVTVSLQVCFSVLFTRLVLKTRKVTLVSR
jgi:hypothetical protein